MQGCYVQYGAGLSAPEGWQNFDASPRLRFERLPLAAKLFGRLFPPNVMFGDIVRGLPIKDASARGVYASHVLEHLSRQDFEVALANTFRLLMPGGRFRLVVPDLEARARHYINSISTNPMANDAFMRSTLLGREHRPQGMVERLRLLLGNSQHLWMWDPPSMMAALKRAGFDAIRRCEFGDSGDPMFDRVEEHSRFFDGRTPECAIECFRPG